jgi:hypothetical protein
VPRSVRSTVVVVLVAAAVAPTAWAAAGRTAGAEPRRIASYCSETGDLCFGVLDRSGAVSLEIDTFARYFDRYFLCVRPPRGSTTCKSFSIRKVGRLYTSKVRWYGNFPARGAGTYVVTWKLRAHALGPALKFRLPLR